MGNGHDLVIKAPNNSAANVYVQSLKINGAPTDRTSFSQAEIARGGTLEFDMGPNPSRYGVKSPPPSLTKPSR